MNELLGTLNEGIPDLLGICGFDGSFKYLNGAAWTRSLGWEPQEITAQPFINLVHPDDVERTLQTFERLLQGKPVRVEENFRNRYRHKRGGYVWLWWTCFSSIQSQLIFASARDVTERVRLELEVAQLDRDLVALRAELRRAEQRTTVEIATNGKLAGEVERLEAENQTLSARLVDLNTQLSVRSRDLALSLEQIEGLLNRVQELEAALAAAQAVDPSPDPPPHPGPLPPPVALPPPAVEPPAPPVAQGPPGPPAEPPGQAKDKGKDKE